MTFEHLMKKYFSGPVVLNHAPDGPERRYLGSINQVQAALEQLVQARIPVQVRIVSQLYEQSEASPLVRVEWTCPEEPHCNWEQVRLRAMDSGYAVFVSTIMGA